MADGGGILTQPATLLGQDDGGALAAEQVTLLGAAGLGGTVGSGLISVDPSSLGGSGSGCFDATGGFAAEAPVLFAASALVSGATADRATMSGSGLTGSVGRGQLLAQTPSLLAVGSGVIVGTGGLIARPARVGGRGYVQIVGTGGMVAERPLAVGTGKTGVVARGALAPTLALLDGEGYVVVSGAGGLVVPRAAMYGIGEEAVSSTIRTWAMNTRSGAVTAYTEFPMNSLARYNGLYLGAGPTGLFLLSGGDDPDWRLRTGFMDDKFSGKKRLTELLLGLRYSKAIRVRVWVNEDEYYDYTLANYSPDVLSQVRAKIGKGLSSRYFRVELMGEESSVEIDSLQLTMPHTTRRLG